MEIMHVVAILLIVASVLALIGLLIGAIFNLQIKEEARETLWRVFWAGLIAGGIILYFFRWRF